MKIRCSKLDRIMTCHASAFPQPGETRIDHESGEAARIGTAVHAVMADIVRNRWTTVPDVVPYCVEAGCADAKKDVRILSYNGMAFLREYRKFLSEEPQVEIGFELVKPWGVLTGHPDIVDYVEAGGERIVYVIDWKTGEEVSDGDAEDDAFGLAHANGVGGFEGLGLGEGLEGVDELCLVNKDDDYRYQHQMAGYADLGLTHFAEWDPQKVIVTIAWLRTQEQTTKRFSRTDIFSHDAQLASLFVERFEAPAYTPGDACRYCPRVAACPGRRDLMLASVDVLTSGGVDMVPFNGHLVDPTGFARSITQARMLKTLCEDHLRMAADAVKSLGGEVVAPNGQKVVLVSRAGRPTLKPEKVLPYLRDRFEGITDEELAEMVTLSKGGVETFVASKADRGEKKALKEDVFETLEQMGAMTRGNPVEFVEVKQA